MLFQEVFVARKMHCLTGEVVRLWRIHSAIVTLFVVNYRLSIVPTTPVMGHTVVENRDSVCWKLSDPASDEGTEGYTHLLTDN